MPGKTHSVRPPKQERSRQTLERILSATERLLDDRSFESITLAQIVAAAGTSTGAFYTRFRDKESLLPALYQRYDAWFTDWSAARATDRPQAPRDLVSVVTHVVDDMVAMFSHRPNLLRALSVHARRHPEMIDDDTRARRTRQMSYVRDALLACRDEIDHPDPERAVDLAAFFGATSCREAILFGDATHAKQIGLPSDELAREVVRLMLSYLKGPR